MTHMGKTSVDPQNPEELNAFLSGFKNGYAPPGCPSLDNPALAPYQNVYDLYADVACTNNCPQSQSLSKYPYEPDIGGPDYYRNGFHDMHRREK